MMLHEVEKRLRIAEDVGFGSEQIFVLFRYTFGHPMRPLSNMPIWACEFY
jgi:hypothetical protein